LKQRENLGDLGTDGSTILIDPKEIGSKVVDWIHLAQKRIGDGLL
jgi:hypothetical protein